MTKKKNILLSIICILTVCCKKNEYSKQKALLQSYHCLKIKNESGLLFNSRNKYLLKMVKGIENKTVINDSIKNSILILSKKINQQNIINKQFLTKLKQEHSDIRFIEATIEFIEIGENLEAKSKLLFESLLDSDNDKNRELKIGKEVRIETKNIALFRKQYEHRESKFHNENSISQKEVDSIVKIIKNETTIANNGYN